MKYIPLNSKPIGHEFLNMEAAVLRTRVLLLLLLEHLVHVRLVQLRVDLGR